MIKDVATFFLMAKVSYEIGIIIRETVSSLIIAQKKHRNYFEIVNLCVEIRETNVFWEFLVRKGRESF
ncbi:hypothetical protein B0A80_15365 [Flavobacterium tructae]|nr:hypothetical protein B0A80_15365 [Flavobacterium tructae]